MSISAFTFSNFTRADRLRDLPITANRVNNRTEPTVYNVLNDDNQRSIVGVHSVVDSQRDGVLSDGPVAVADHQTFTIHNTHHYGYHQDPNQPS